MPIERATILLFFLWLLCGACVSTPTSNGPRDFYPPLETPAPVLRESALPDGRRAIDGAVRVYASHQTSAHVTLAVALPLSRLGYRVQLADDASEGPAVLATLDQPGDPIVSAVESALAKDGILLLGGAKEAERFDSTLRTNGFRVVETRWVLVWVEGS